MILQYPLRTEKAVRMLELDNTIVFVVDKRASKPEIKKEIENSFKVKVQSVNTEIRDNKKIAYIKLAKESKAIDVATKLGLM